MKEETQIQIDNKREPGLKKVFDRYIEDSITDEQVNRVLNLVLSLIEEGRFNRPRRFFGIGGMKKSRSVKIYN